MKDKAIPSTGEYFGCPYKFYSDEHLEKIFIEKNLEKHQIKEILDLNKTQNNLACRKAFEFLHPEIPKVSQGIGKHPNAYYLSSYFYHRKREHRKSGHRVERMRNL